MWIQFRYIQAVSDFPLGGPGIILTVAAIKTNLQVYVTPEMREEAMKTLETNTGRKHIRIFVSSAHNYLGIRAWFLTLHLTRPFLR